MPTDQKPTLPQAMPPLSADDVRAWVGDTAIQRGRPYVQRSIANPRRTGATLKARVQGSEETPYRVEVALRADGIEHADCSCPVGSGRCKHVAAVLLAYVEDPALFAEVEDVEASLERRSKSELIALIRRMLAREPDLELLLELPAPGPSGAPPPVNEEQVRRQVLGAIGGRGRDGYDDWDGGGFDSHALDPVVQLGRNYVSANDWHSAIIVFETIARQLLERYEDLYDEAGEVNEVVDACVGGLGECLDAATDPAQRETILRALFHIYDWDIQYGGIDMGYQAPEIIAHHATPDERQMLGRWVRAVLATDGDSWSSSFKRQRYGGFLLELAGDTVDDETFLQISRETGRTSDLVERLLVLGRVDAALAEVRAVGDVALLSLAELFSARGEGDRLEQIVRERLNSGQHSAQMISWLKDQARARNDLAEALRLSEMLFWQQPSLPRYDEIAEIAGTQGVWAQQRPALLKRLTQQSQHALLTEIHLKAGEVGDALQLLPKVQRAWYQYGEAPLHIRVARAAERDYPREALSMYTSAAESLIQAQGRDNYRAAADYLLRVRELYKRLSETSTWERYITDLRTQNKRLRALKEELEKAAI